MQTTTAFVATQEVAEDVILPVLSQMSATLRDMLACLNADSAVNQTPSASASPLVVRARELWGASWMLGDTTVTAFSEGMHLLVMRVTLSLDSLTSEWRTAFSAACQHFLLAIGRRQAGDVLWTRDLLAAWPGLLAIDSAGILQAGRVLTLKLDVSVSIDDDRSSEAKLTDQTRVTYPDASVLFDSGLLRLLRAQARTDHQQAAEIMTRALAQLADFACLVEVRREWRVLQAVGESLGRADSLSMLDKRLFAAIGRLLRQTAERRPVRVPPPLLRDALYYLTVAHSRTALGERMMLAYGLLPSDVETAEQSRLLAVADILPVQVAIEALTLPLATSEVVDAPDGVGLARLADGLATLPWVAECSEPLRALQRRFLRHWDSLSDALPYASVLLVLQQLVEASRWCHETQQRGSQLAQQILRWAEDAVVPDLGALRDLSSPLYQRALGDALRENMFRTVSIIGQHAESLPERFAYPQEREAELRALASQLRCLDGALLMTDSLQARQQVAGICTLLATLSENDDSDPTAFWPVLAEQIVSLEQSLLGRAEGLWVVPRPKPVLLSAGVPPEDPADPVTASPIADRPAGSARKGSPEPVLRIFLDEARQCVARLREGLARWSEQPQSSGREEALHAAHTLAGCSASVGIVPMQQLAQALESALDDQQILMMSEAFLLPACFGDALTALEQLLDEVTTGARPSLPSAVLAALTSLAIPRTVAASEIPLPLLDVPNPCSDRSGAACDIDPADNLPAGPVEKALGQTVKGMLSPAEDLGMAADLLTVFADEASDLLPRLDLQLQSWLASPKDAAAPGEMLRILHTLKGSARMAGERELGESLHQMEQQVNDLMRAPIADSMALQHLQHALDQLLHRYGGTESPPTMADLGDVTESVSVREQVQTSQTSHPAGDSPTLRVRASLLDRIAVNGADLMTSTAAISASLRQHHQSIEEWSIQLERLRRQLRELDLLAESGIAAASPLATGAGGGFDPLELDRYTPLHELTRMMAETLSDLASMQRLLEHQQEAMALSALAQQRLARQLQQDIVQARTHTFSRLTPRFQHLVRRVAQECGRDVTLRIEGAGLAIDRSLLDGLTGVLEHLLRNAIVHGIEPANEREAAGKPRQGQLVLSILQQQDQLQLELCDDGRGLDYARIRARALEMGLITDADDPEATSLSEVVFTPGFSTAAELTPLAGRGVGLDAVRTTLQSMGGAIRLVSHPGMGTRATIALPLSLALLRVLRVWAGQRELALPSSLIRELLSPQTTVNQFHTDEKSIAWQGSTVPVYRLAELLGDALPQAVPVAPSAPLAPAVRPHLVVLQQLDQQIAVEVDAVVGLSEVMMQPLGPQLATVPGLAGLTVTADGQVLLIINPFALVISGKPVAGAPRPTNMDICDSVTTPLPRVLVVDDSLTVRRALAHLLEKHGYQVDLARDGLEALDCLRTNCPMAVLLDIEMPRMDGLELLSQLRGHEHWRALPVAMITSRNSDRHRALVFQRGANACLGKPYQEEQLLNLLASWRENGPVLSTYLHLGEAHEAPMDH